MNRHRSPTWGNLDAQILEFLFLACWNPESRKILLVKSGILNFGIQIQLKESGIPQEEISLPFVTVKRKEKWVILESRIHCVELRIQQECKPFQYFKKKNHLIVIAIELYKFLWCTVNYEPYKSGDNQDWHSMDRAKIFVLIMLYWV